MLKTKNILIAVIIIVVIGMGCYFLFTSVSKTKTPPAEEVLPVAEPAEKEFQGMKYEIIGVNFNRAVYDIITGKLTEEQVKTLAEKIIGDVTAENPSVEDITLLFYSDLISVGVGECDVAQVTWIPNEITVKIIEE